MQTLIFLFALLTTPADRWLCDMWTSTITREGVIAACGVDLLEGLRLDIYHHDDMTHVCAVDAVYLTDLAELAEICQLKKTLDHYVLRIVEPGYTTLLCYVRSDHEDAPTSEEIAAQCPDARDYIVEFAGTMKPEEDAEFTCPPRPLTAGIGLYQQASSATSLLTDDDLTWLAGKLITSGMVRTNCADGGIHKFSGIATPCGMAAARARVVKWQNQFDAEIYSAALAYNVPAKLLKRIMGIESQFWPFYVTADGERGVMQITDNGLDTLHRFDPTIDPFYFDRTDEGKLWSRAVTRDALVCVDCTLMESVQKIKTDMPIFARLLAAYHCRAVTINPALAGDLAWAQAVVDYNGSFDYLERIQQ